MSDFLINNFPSVFTNSNLINLKFGSMMMFLFLLFALFSCVLWVFNSFYDVFARYRFLKCVLSSLTLVTVFTMFGVSTLLYTTIDSGLNDTIHDNYVEKVTGKVTKMSNDKKEFVLENGDVVKAHFTDKPVYVNKSIKSYYEYVGYKPKKGLTKNQKLSVECFLKLDRNINKDSYSQVRPVMSKWN